MPRNTFTTPQRDHSRTSHITKLDHTAASPRVVGGRRITRQKTRVVYMSEAAHMSGSIPQC